MQTLVEKLSNPEAALYYTEAFRDFIEMNMSDLKRSSITNAPLMEVTEAEKARADRDFNLLCNMANIPFHMHWFTARVNGLKSFRDYRPSDADLYTVDPNKFASLVLNFTDSQTIT